MAYTTVDKIKSMFRSIKIEASGTSIITSEVENWISEVEAVMDAKLANFYATPITGTESLKIMQQISTWKVAHIIKTILEMTEQKSDKVQEVQTNLDKKADELMKQILPGCSPCGSKTDPVMPLPDAPTISFAPTSASITSSKSLDATFTKGGDNW